MRVLHPSWWNRVLSGHRLYLPFLLVALFCTSLYGGIQALSESYNGHVFLVEDRGEFYPVVGVVSKNKVVVLGKDQQTRTLNLNNEVRVQEKELIPVGRATITQLRHRTQKGGLQGANPTVFHRDGEGIGFVEVSPETTIVMDLIADRPIPSAYMVLFSSKEQRIDPSTVFFLPLGDIPQGEVFQNKIVYSDYRPLSEWRYKFEVYSGGNPIELHNLSRVLKRKDSQSLQIPWSERLDAFLRFSKRRERTSDPSVFQIRFDQLNTSDVKGRGVSQLNLVLSVDVDGRVEVLENDPSLTPEEAGQLVSDAAAWQIFPACKKGKAKTATITLPLKL